MYWNWKEIIGTAIVLFLLFDFTPRQHTRDFLGSLSASEPAAQTAPAPKSE